MTGDYKVVVRDNRGDSVAKNEGDDSYKLQIVITGLSISSGSIEGGNTLVLTGENFSPEKLDNQVLIGEAYINEFCDIFEASST